MNLADVRFATARFDGELTIEARDTVTGTTYPITTFVVGQDNQSLVADVPPEMVTAAVTRTLEAVIAQVTTP
jgi:hypothetical protein